MNIRLQYTKIGDIRYISHLDILKMMERIFRRGKIPIAYSEGFNPHPKMSFSPALQLGTESLCEYIDVELREPMTPMDIIQALNKVTVKGVEFVDGTVLPEKPGSIVAFLSHSDYEIELTWDRQETAERLSSQMIQRIQDLNDSSERVLTRKTKKGNLLEYNMKEFMGEIQYQENDMGLEIRLTVCSGSEKSLNPKVVLGELLKDMDPEEYYYILRKVSTYHWQPEDGTRIYPLEHKREQLKCVETDKISGEIEQ